MPKNGRSKPNARNDESRRDDGDIRELFLQIARHFGPSSGGNRQDDSRDVRGLRSGSNDTRGGRNPHNSGSGSKANDANGSTSGSNRRKPAKKVAKRKNQGKDKSGEHSESRRDQAGDSTQRNGRGGSRGGNRNDNKHVEDGNNSRSGNESPERNGQRSKNASRSVSARNHKKNEAVKSFMEKAVGYGKNQPGWDSESTYRRVGAKTRVVLQVDPESDSDPSLLRGENGFKLSLPRSFSIVKTSTCFMHDGQGEGAKLGVVSRVLLLVEKDGNVILTSGKDTFEVSSSEFGSLFNRKTNKFVAFSDMAAEIFLELVNECITKLKSGSDVVKSGGFDAVVITLPAKVTAVLMLHESLSTEDLIKVYEGHHEPHIPSQFVLDTFDNKFMLYTNRA